MDAGSLLNSPAAATAAVDESRADRSGAKLADDFSTFMTLLTTQLQNQDPLDPMKSNEFTQQLVAFTGVEQQIATNQNLEKLAQLTQLNNMAGASSYLSREAVVAGAQATLDGGDAVWEYQVSDPTDSVTLNVLDSAGNIVYSQPGNDKLGTHGFTWDGKASDGTQLSEGIFSLQVKATNDAGEQLNIPIYVTDRIVSVDTRGAEPIFQVGANSVNQSGILALAVGDKY